MRPVPVRALLLVLLLLPAGPAAAAELTVSAAISVKEAVEEIGRAFAAARPGLRLRFNLGASGALQKQIEAGAPVDVFVAAAAGPMDELERRGRVEAGSRRAFARNVLVVVRPAAAAGPLAGPADLAGPGVKRIAVGNPRTVPAGRYAEASLRRLGLWERLQPRLVLAEHVRQALDYVARGEVDAGFVYATDAAARAPRVREAFRPPADSYGPIVYPAAVVAGSRQPALARAFVDTLAGAQARAVLARHGFAPPPAGAR
jgi:molybdate transport system substrate-binding protein